MSPRRTRIESLGVYLPSREVSTEEVLAGCLRRPRLPLEVITGIRSRRVGGEGEYAIDLAERAAADCLSRSAYRPADVDLVIACQISRCDGPGLHVTYEPSTAATLCQRLGIRAPGFNVSNACAGMMTGALIADAFLRAGALRRVLVVSGEYCSHIARTAQLEIAGDLDPRIACLTAGDAGAALLLDGSPSPDAGFHFLELYTLSAFADCCTAGPTDRPHGGAIMWTDAIRMAAAGRPHLMPHALAALEQAGWRPEEVQRIIPHQASRASIQEGLRAINALLGREVCDARNVVDNLRERGNTGSTTHTVALHDLMMRGDLRDGDRVLLSITGSGLTVGTALYQFDDLPARVADGAPTAPPPTVEALPAALAPVAISAIGLSAPPAGRAADTLELAAAAAEDCLARAATAREEVDVLICAGQYRSGYAMEPAEAAALAGRLGLNHDVGWPAPRRTLAFDLNAGASGTLAAIDAAAQLIRSGAAKKVLVVAAEVDANLSHPPHPPRGLAEVGSAVLLQAATLSEGLGRVHRVALPEHAQRLSSWVRQDAGKTLLCVEEDPGYEALLLDGLARAATVALQAEGLALAEVDLVLGPQRTTRFHSRLAERLEVEPSRVVDALQGDARDLFTSALPAALRHCEGRGARIALLIDGGSGIQAGAAIYRFGGRR